MNILSLVKVEFNLIDILFYTSIILLFIVVLFMGSERLKSPIFQKIMLYVLIFIAILAILTSFMNKGNKPTY